MPIKDLEERKRRAAVYSKAHYEKNKAAVIARVARNKKANRTWFSTFKRTLKCTNCGENHPATLDFHHVIHQKDNKKVNELVSDGHARARILQEIEKCVVLCSNCHRIWHHDERENRRKRIAKKKKQAKIHTIPTNKGVKTMARRKRDTRGRFRKNSPAKRTRKRSHRVVVMANPRRRRRSAWP